LKHALKMIRPQGPRYETIKKNYEFADEMDGIKILILTYVKDIVADMQYFEGK